MPSGLLSPTHLLLLGLIALLVFGPKRLPEIGRSLGHGLRGFKESVSGERPEGIAATEVAAAEPLALSDANARTAGRPVEPVSDDQAQKHAGG